MTAEAATEHQVKGWLALYHDQQVRVASRPNDHNLCHVVGENFSSYASLRQLQTVTDAAGQPIVDPEFDPKSQIRPSLYPR